MVFYLIGFLIISYSISHFKKGFFYFLIYRMMLVQNITMISLPGVPLLTLEVFMSLFFVMMFLIHRKRLRKEKESFPFIVPFIALTFSWTVSMIFAIAGIGNAFSAYIKDVCGDMLLIYIMWKLIENEKDFKFLIKGFVVLVFFSCLYGIFEGLIESNPLSEYEMSFNSDDERTLNYDYSKDVWRGYRVKSFFEHAIGGGVMWAISITMLLFSFGRKEIRPISKMMAICIIALCLICILLTKSRGPILFLLISGIGFIRIKSRIFFFLVIFGILILYAGWPFFGQFTDNILSIFSSKAQENVGGSGSAMRIEQLSAAYLLMLQSPVWGLGFKFQNVLNNALTDSLLGSESMWFTILPTFGLLGIVAYLILAYYSIITIPKKYHSRELFFFTLAYWVVGSLTSLPGLKMYYYYFVMFLIIKYSMIKYHS